MRGLVDGAVFGCSPPSLSLRPKLHPVPSPASRQVQPSDLRVLHEIRGPVLENVVEATLEGARVKGLDGLLGDVPWN
jgi:hypothetical protein